MSRPEDRALGLLQQAAREIEELQLAARADHQYLQAVNLAGLRTNIVEAVRKFTEVRDRQSRRQVLSAQTSLRPQ